MLYCNSNQLQSMDISNNTALEYFACDNNPGDGTQFPVDAWFDDTAIPQYFTTGSWMGITITYRKK